MGTVLGEVYKKVSAVLESSSEDGLENHRWKVEELLLSILSRGFDEDEYLNSDDDGLTYEEKKLKLERAKEIASGLVIGTFENDEDVWGLVKNLKGEKNG